MGRITMAQGKGSLMHNRRAYTEIGRKTPDNIDQSRTRLNKTYVDRNLRQAYDDIFGEALKKYNDKQTRPERQIDDYLTHIRKSKNGEHDFYEVILQWGSMEDYLYNPEYRPLIRKVFDEYVRTWSKRNPNLELIGAYLHMDESSPHLHIDYIPVAHGYKRGLECRNSLDRALQEMGYKPDGTESKVNNATMAWQAAERTYFGELCRHAGLEVEQSRPSRGRSLSVADYKDARRKLDAELRPQVLGDLQTDKKALEADLNALEADLSAKAEQIHIMDEVALRMAQNGSKRHLASDITIPAKKTLTGRIQEPARHGAFVEGLSAEQLVNEINRAAARTTIAATVEKAADEVGAAQRQRDELMAEIKELGEEKRSLANEISVMEKTRDGLDEFFWGQSLNGRSVEEDVEIPVKKSVLAELIGIADIERPMSYALKALIKVVTGLGEVIEKANSRRKR